MKFAVCLLLLPNYLLSQMQEKGTLVLAAICQDGGIVLLADSRTSFSDQNNNVSAYYDETPKLYQHKDVIFSMEGKVGFGKKTFHELYEKFKKEFTEDIPIDSFLDTLFKFMTGELVQEEYDILMGNKFFVCGTVNKESKIIFKWKEQVDTLTKPGEYRISFPKDESEKIMRAIMLNNPAHTAVVQFKQAFENFLSFRNKEAKAKGQLYVSGGPYQFARLQRDILIL